MTPYDVDTTRFVLAVALAFIIAIGLIYRYFRWLGRRRTERRFDQFAASQAALARTTAQQPSRATQQPASPAEPNTGAAAATNSDAVLALINGSQPTAGSSPAPQTRAPAYQAPEPIAARTPAPVPVAATVTAPVTAPIESHSAPAASAVPASDAILALINGSQGTASSAPAPQTRAPAYQAPEPIAAKTPAPAPVTAPATAPIVSQSAPAQSEPAASAVPASDAILALINGAQPAPDAITTAPAAALPDVAAISAQIAAGREAARLANASAVVEAPTVPDPPSRAAVIATPTPAASPPQPAISTVAAISAAIASGREAERSANTYAVVEQPDVPDPPARETATPVPGPATAAPPAENKVASVGIRPDVSATINPIAQHHASAPANAAVPEVAHVTETHVKPDMLFTLAPGACKTTAAAAALLPKQPAPDFTIREVRTVMPDVRATLSPHAGASAPAVPPPAAGATPAASSNTNTEPAQSKPETPRARTASRRIGKAASSTGLISTAPLSRKVLLGKVSAADQIQQAAFRPLKKRPPPYISSLSPEKVGFDAASLRQRLFGGDPPPHTPQR